MFNKSQRAILQSYTVGDLSNPARVEWIAWFMDLMS